ncbi:hypothetical protein ACH4OW_02290 [Streptomyces sp. NPDC017056]|uniref:hypothetical protein n=1 Tax=Streptomyces sp. NPDC017056 TaxID=3364973 RepID=UPI003791266C
MTTTPGPPSDRAAAVSGGVGVSVVPERSAGAVSHVVPAAGRDLSYRHDRGEIELPVTVHFCDGSTAQTALLLDPGQVELFALQAEQAIGRRAAAKRAELLSGG